MSEIVIEPDTTHEQQLRKDKKMLKQVKKQLKESQKWDKENSLNDILILNKNELEVLKAYRVLILKQEERVKRNHMKEMLRQIKKLE